MLIRKENDMKTGIIEFILSGVGSKSEKMQPFLKEDDGNLVEIFKESDNPFKNDTLKEYEGKKVTITGEENEYGLFIIDTIEVIEEKADAEEAPIRKADIEIIEEKTEDNVTDAPTEEPIAKEIPTEAPVEEKPLHGLRKFFAFFRKK